MQDQVQALRKHNISAYAIHEGMEKTDISAIKDGTATVLMASPESVITRHWKELIRDTYGDKLCVVAYDEAHCISEWGLEFREDYQKVGILQSLLEAPVLALTATATKEIHKDITRVLGLHEDTKVLATLPDRFGIRCGVETLTKRNTSSRSSEFCLQYAASIGIRAYLDIFAVSWR
ncbi:hypothetical protein ScPMuIL_009513 [Solemya velum]